VGDSDRLTRLAGLTSSVVVFVVLPWVAEIVAEVVLDTAVVVTLNVAEVAPAATVTLAGTEALALFEERLTTKPPEGAALNRVTVPVDEVPPTTEFGDTDTPLRPAGLTDKDAVLTVLPCVAEIVTLVEVETEVVATVKVADVAPATTVTLDGTLAVELLEARPMTAPPAGAALYNVTVPVAEVPPSTDVGETDTPLKPSGLTASVAVLVDPFSVAEIVALLEVVTEVVVIVKVAEFAEPATVTLEGTVALELPEERLTTIPAGGAALESVTVPIADVPPVTAVGDTDTPVSVGAVIVSVAVLVTPLNVADIVDDVFDATNEVVTANVVEMAPEGMMRVDGAWAGPVALSVTVKPPAGAAAVRATVAVDVFEPTTVVGESVKLERAGAALTVSGPVNV
jgi:hypothetical protein